MPVPETAVDENDSAVFREDDIRPAGKFFVFRSVDGEAVAEFVEQRTDDDFRFGIFIPDPAHVPGASFRGEMVGHGVLSLQVKEQLKGSRAGRWAQGNLGVEVRGMVRE